MYSSDFDAEPGKEGMGKRGNDQPAFSKSKGKREMNNFTIVYRILKYLEASLDADEFDPTGISAERLKISEERLESLLIMLQDDGYIRGLVIRQVLGETRRHIIEPICPEITLKGLEYLSDNSMMKKAAALLKGAVDLFT